MLWRRSAVGGTPGEAASNAELTHDGPWLIRRQGLPDEVSW
jgi:hypothetical protein